MRWTRPSGISGTLFPITHRVNGPPRHIHEHNLNQEAIPASTVRTDAVRFRGGAFSLATVIVEPASGTPDERSCISTPDRRLPGLRVPDPSGSSQVSAAAQGAITRLHLAR